MTRSYLAAAASLGVLLALAGCGGGGGSSSDPTPTPTPITTPAPAPATTLVVDKAALLFGETTVLRWGSSNASAVSGSNFGADTVSGEVGITPTADTTYTLSVTDGAGRTASAQVSVRVAAVAVRANPTAAANISSDLALAAQVTGAVDTNVTWQVLTPNGGSITPSGVYSTPPIAGVYRVVVVSVADPSMTVAALSQVERLVDAGATVVGMRPECSPSLADDCADFRAVCDRLWGTGRVIEDELEAALVRLGMRPELAIEGGPVRRIARIVDGVRVTFVSNPTDAEVRVRLAPADGRALHAWDPVRVQRSGLHDVEADERGRPRFELVLPPFGSVFVLPGEAAVDQAPSTAIALIGDWRMRVPGGEQLTTSPDPALWTDAGARERSFSGTAVYHHEFTLAEQDVNATSLLLELAEVRDIARIILNGEDRGVAWTAPFMVDVSSAARIGTNDLEVHVATPWRNRLIAEALHATGRIFAPMTSVFEPAADPLPAGLAGRCVLQVHH